MCIAGLNVSTQPCSHRWYELVRPCHPANNLANCPERLKLEGWERRNESCPWCDGHEQDVSSSTHRLFGGGSSSSGAASSASSSASSSPTLSPALGATRSHRSGSAASSDSDRAQRHRDMNDRLHVYLTSDLHDLLPSARKNYPVYAVTAPVDESPASDAASTASAKARAARAWKKRVRFSKVMLTG